MTIQSCQAGTVIPSDVLAAGFTIASNYFYIALVLITMNNITYVDLLQCMTCRLLNVSSPIFLESNEIEMYLISIIRQTL